MKKRILYAALGCAATLVVVGTFWIGDYNLNHGKMPSLLGPNVREKTYQHLETLMRTEYSKQPVKIGGQEYKVTVTKTEPWTKGKELRLGMENLKTGDALFIVDCNDARVGEPEFRSIDDLYVNGDWQRTNKQREKKIDEFLKPLEEDLKMLVKAKIQRQENAWKLSLGEKIDYIEICSIEYMPPKKKDSPSTMTIGTKGYDNDIPEKVDYYVDGDHIFSWNPPRSYANFEDARKEKRTGKNKGWGPQKFTAPCLLDLKKGTHILKAVLKDSKGNQVEDMEVFEVK